MLADAVEEALKKPLKPVAAGAADGVRVRRSAYEKVITREELQAAAKDDERHREALGRAAC